MRVFDEHIEKLKAKEKKRDRDDEEDGKDKKKKRSSRCVRPACAALLHSSMSVA